MIFFPPEFLTCSDHVPIEGIGSFGFVISFLDTNSRFDGAKPSEIMPMVYTCPGFISMDLPAYENEEDTKERLSKALSMDFGFYREQPPSALVPSSNTVQRVT